MLFAEHLYFCFLKNLTVSFAIDETESKGIDVTIGFFRCFL